MDSEPEVQWWPTKVGDRVLLLSEVRTRIPDDEIADVAARPAPLASVVRELLDRARKRGATGEISVLVLVVGSGSA